MISQVLVAMSSVFYVLTFVHLLVFVNNFQTFIQSTGTTSSSSGRRSSRGEVRGRLSSSTSTGSVVGGGGGVGGGGREQGMTEGAITLTVAAIRAEGSDAGRSIPIMLQINSNCFGVIDLCKSVIIA